MHALVFRSWKNRVKGRDWYDFELYVRNRVPLDFKHLQERIRQFNGLAVNQDEFLAMLKDKLATTNINHVKQDVMPFLKNPNELNIWSNEYFLQLSQMIEWE